MDELIAQLRAQLEAAITAHYQHVAAEHEDLYAYVLGTVDTVEYIMPYANTESAVEAKPGDDDYADQRYYAFNWSLEGDDGMYDEVNKVLRLIDRKVVEEVLGKYTGDDVEQVKNAKSLVLETSLEVLKKLEAAGLFGKRTKKRFVSLQIADSENEIMQRSARELNAKSVFEECKSVFPYFDPDNFEEE